MKPARAPKNVDGYLLKNLCYHGRCCLARAFKNIGDYCLKNLVIMSTAALRVLFALKCTH